MIAEVSIFFLSQRTLGRGIYQLKVSPEDFVFGVFIAVLVGILSLVRPFLLSRRLSQYFIRTNVSRPLPVKRRPSFLSVNETFQMPFKPAAPPSPRHTFQLSLARRHPNPPHSRSTPPSTTSPTRYRPRLAPFLWSMKDAKPGLSDDQIELF